MLTRESLHAYHSRVKSKNINLQKFVCWYLIFFLVDNCIKAGGSARIANSKYAANMCVYRVRNCSQQRSCVLIEEKKTKKVRVASWYKAHLSLHTKLKLIKIYNSTRRRWLGGGKKSESWNLQFHESKNSYFFRFLLHHKLSLSCASDIDFFDEFDWTCRKGTVTLDTYITQRVKSRRALRLTTTML